MEHKFIRLNTIFVPSEELTREVLQIASEISKEKDEIFHIDNKNFFAHLTIYSPEYPVENLEVVLEEVRKIAKESLPIKLEFEGFHSGWGYVGVEFKKTKQIEEMHKTVVERLNPCRDGYIREKYDKEIAEGKYSAEQVGYIQNYGYHNLFNTYHPHLTLCRFASEEIAAEIVRDLTARTQIPDSDCVSLAVCEMGPNGTCTKILREFKIGK